MKKFINKNKKLLLLFIFIFIFYYLDIIQLYISRTIKSIVGLIRSVKPSDTCQTQEKINGISNQEYKKMSGNQNDGIISIYDKEGNTKFIDKYFVYESDYKKELKYIKELNNIKGFLELVEYDDETLCIRTKYAGVPLTKENLPIDWEYQIRNIENILLEKEIFHNDIHSPYLTRHFFVKDDIITLIDFGLADKYSIHVGHSLLPMIQNNDFDGVIQHIHSL